MRYILFGNTWSSMTIAYITGWVLSHVALRLLSIDTTINYFTTFVSIALINDIIVCNDEKNYGEIPGAIWSFLRTCIDLLATSVGIVLATIFGILLYLNLPKFSYTVEAVLAAVIVCLFVIAMNLARIYSDVRNIQTSNYSERIRNKHVARTKKINQTNDWCSIVRPLISEDYIRCALGYDMHSRNQDMIDDYTRGANAFCAAVYTDYLNGTKPGERVDYVLTKWNLILEHNELMHFENVCRYDDLNSSTVDTMIAYNKYVVYDENVMSIGSHLVWDTHHNKRTMKATLGDNYEHTFNTMFRSKNPNMIVFMCSIMNIINNIMTVENAGFTRNQFIRFIKRSNKYPTLTRLIELSMMPTNDKIYSFVRNYVENGPEISDSEYINMLVNYQNSISDYSTYGTINENYEGTVTDEIYWSIQKFAIDNHMRVNDVLFALAMATRNYQNVQATHRRFAKFVTELFALGTRIKLYTKYPKEICVSDDDIDEITRLYGASIAASAAKITIADQYAFHPRIGVEGIISSYCRIFYDEIPADCYMILRTNDYAILVHIINNEPVVEEFVTKTNNNVIDFNYGNNRIRLFDNSTNNVDIDVMISTSIPRNIFNFTNNVINQYIVRAKFLGAYSPKDESTLSARSIHIAPNKNFTPQESVSDDMVMV